MVERDGRGRAHGTKPRCIEHVVAKIAVKCTENYYKKLDSECLLSIDASSRTRNLQREAYCMTYSETADSKGGGASTGSELSEEMVCRDGTSQSEQALSSEAGMVGAEFCKGRKRGQCSV